MRRITVFHNVAADHLGRHLGMLDGYTPGHPLVPVLQWDSNDNTRGVTEVLNWCFRELNIGEESDVATHYRAARNRSLSVGDVIAVSSITPAGRVDHVFFYTCAPAGWEDEHQPPFYVWASGPGTTALDDTTVKPWLPSAN